MKNLSWGFSLPPYLKEILDEYEEQNQNPDMAWLEDLRTKLLNLGITKEKVEKARDNFGDFLGDNQKPIIQVLLNALEKNEEIFEEEERERERERAEDSRRILGPLARTDEFRVVSGQNSGGWESGLPTEESFFVSKSAQL